MKQTESSGDCFSSGCHAGLKETPAVHGPVAAGACGECHAVEDADEHTFRLTRSDETMCTFCHSVSTEAKVLHKPFAESRCLDCHDPHGGRTRVLLRAASADSLCAKCHEPFADPLLHEPVTKGECSRCHVSHKSDAPHLLVASGKSLCATSGCHTRLEELMASAPHVHGPAAVDCSVCHLPHGGERPAFLRETPRTLCVGCHDTIEEKIGLDAYVHGPLRTESGCAECHTPHASESAMQLRATSSEELCLGCHNREIYSPTARRTIGNVAAQIRSSRFKHGPVETGDCQGCHFSHSAAHPNLLRERYVPEFYQEFDESDYSLCFRCHERELALVERTRTATRFRDGDRNLHYLHVHRKKGRTCRVCHEVHASDNPSQLRESIPFGSTGWKLPIGHEKTPTGGRCASGCHREVGYDNSDGGE